MKLLFDQNLAPRLANRLADLYPGSAHVQSLGLDMASDQAFWTFAQNNGFTILSKDEDFNDLSVMQGFPPKVIWLQLGNCTTDEIESALRTHHAEIESFMVDPNVGTFVLK